MGFQETSAEITLSASDIHIRGPSSDSVRSSNMNAGTRPDLSKLARLPSPRYIQKKLR